MSGLFLALWAHGGYLAMGERTLQAAHLSFAVAITKPSKRPLRLKQ